MPARSSFALPVNMEATEGPVGIPVNLDFTGGDISNGDFALEQSSNVITFVQALWIDNSLNTKLLSISFSGTNQILKVKANTQGYYPIMPFQGTFRWNATSVGAAVIVPVIFVNVAIGAMQWATV